ncbi:MAG: YceI family protein [Sandaracinaceae bacterium]|nr:YceI family protein [Sandaracinaceae bacterium]
MTTQRWNIDITHSGINFSVRHMVFAKVRGRFAKWSGLVQFDPDQPTRGQVEVTIDAASIDTGVADRDKHLRSADFFDAERFTTLRFESTKFEQNDGGELKVHGALTLRDITRDVVLDASFLGAGKDPWGNQRVAFSASTSVDRRDFGLEWNQALEAGGLLVGERVDIEIEVQAVAAASEQAA